MSNPRQAADKPLAWRPRVSLLTLLLLLTILGMAAALWRLGNEVVPLRNEVARLRDEAGYITVGNPKHLHAIRIWTPDSTENGLIWRWRVRIPEQGTFYLHNRPFKVPEAGVPESTGMRSGHPLMPGEYVFDLRIVPDPDRAGQLNGHIQGWNDTNVYGSQIKIRERLQSGWTSLHEESGWQQMLGKSLPHRKTTASAPDEPLVLLRLRAGKVLTIRNEQNGSVQWEFQRAEGDSDGLLIWIADYERRKPRAVAP